jgi:hypothetical protein
MRMKQLVPIGVLILSSSAAMAGLVQLTPVTVTLNPDGSGSANGSMASARFSKNAIEFLGCGVRRIENSAGVVLAFGFCQAMTADNVNGFCETENLELIESIGDIDDFSFITFAWNADGVCRSIGASTQSFYIPDK